MVLTCGAALLVDEDDEALARAFRWRLDHKGYPHRITWKDRRRVKLSLHRIIAAAVSGQLVDHRDGDPLNLTKQNLLLCNYSENGANMRRSRNQQRGLFKGVVKNATNGKWRAKLKHLGKWVSLGSYDTAEQAARAYDIGARNHFGDFAALNFPQAAEAR